jgi:alpha-beta hydrolase superfamily lysophospholipase
MVDYDEVLPRALRLGDDVPASERRGDLHLLRYARPEAPAAAIVLHGGGGHARLLAPYGRLLAAHGLDVTIPDLPGYGRSAARSFRYETWVEAVAGLVRAEPRPTLLLGASMGGMLAWHAAAALPRGEVAHVVATTLMDARRPEVRRAAACFGAVGALAVPVLERTRRVTDDLRLPMPWLGDVAGIANDPRIARAIARDPLGGGRRVPLGFLRSWMTYEPALEPEAWDRAPVTLLHPGDDRWTPTALSLGFFDRLPGPKHFAELPDGGHLPVEPRALEALELELGAVVASLEPARA